MKSPDQARKSYKQKISKRAKTFNESDIPRQRLCEMLAETKANAEILGNIIRMSEFQSVPPQYQHLVDLIKGSK